MKKSSKASKPLPVKCFQNSWNGLASFKMLHSFDKFCHDQPSLMNGGCPKTAQLSAFNHRRSNILGVRLVGQGHIACIQLGPFQLHQSSSICFRSLPCSLASRSGLGRCLCRRSSRRIAIPHVTGLGSPMWV